MCPLSWNTLSEKISIVVLVDFMCICLLSVTTTAARVWPVLAMILEWKCTWKVIHIFVMTIFINNPAKSLFSRRQTSWKQSSSSQACQTNHFETYSEMSDFAGKNRVYQDLAYHLEDGSMLFWVLTFWRYQTSKGDKAFHWNNLCLSKNSSGFLVWRPGTSPKAWRSLLSLTPQARKNEPIQPPRSSSSYPVCQSMLLQLDPSVSGKIKTRM